MLSYYSAVTGLRLMQCRARQLYQMQLSYQIYLPF